MKTILNVLKSTIQLAKQKNLSAEDTKFIGSLGWIAALSISIATAAAGA